MFSANRAAPPFYATSVPRRASMGCRSSSSKTPLNGIVGRQTLGSRHGERRRALASSSTVLTSGSRRTSQGKAVLDEETAHVAEERGLLLLERPMSAIREVLQSGPRDVLGDLLDVTEASDVASAVVDHRRHPDARELRHEVVAAKEFVAAVERCRRVDRPAIDIGQDAGRRRNVLVVERHRTDPVRPKRLIGTVLRGAGKESAQGCLLRGGSAQRIA